MSSKNKRTGDPRPTCLAWPSSCKILALHGDVLPAKRDDGGEANSVSSRHQSLNPVPEVAWPVVATLVVGFRARSSPSPNTPFLGTGPESPDTTIHCHTIPSARLRGLAFATPHAPLLVPILHLCGSLFSGPRNCQTPQSIHVRLTASGHEDPRGATSH